MLFRIPAEADNMQRVIVKVLKIPADMRLEFSLHLVPAALISSTQKNGHKIY